MYTDDDFNKRTSEQIKLLAKPLLDKSSEKINLSDEENINLNSINKALHDRMVHNTREPPTTGSCISYIIVYVLILLIISIIGILDYYRLATTSAPVKFFIRDDLLGGASGAFILDILWMFMALFTPFVLYGLFHTIIDLIDIRNGKYTI